MRFKNSRGKFKYIILMLLAVFLLSNRGFRGLVRNSLEYRRLQKAKTALELERVSLEKDLLAVKAPGMVEQTARRKLGLLRPNEIEYRFTPPKKGD
jgi:cell division protein FtsB